MSKQYDNQEESPLTANAVKDWCSRIRDAKKEVQKDFDRMRENMEFASGLQWADQEEIQSQNYVANLTLRTLNQKKSVLYAKNPKAEVMTRERLEFQLWDGKMETLMLAYQAVQMNPMDVHAMATLNDYLIGMQRKQIVRRVGDTIRILYEWNVDEQQPSFKTQMKDLVGRVIVCGVGYVKMSFVRDALSPLSSSDSDKSTIADRAKRAQALLEKIQNGDVEADDPIIESLRLLVNGMSIPSAYDDPNDVTERLVFDFLPATSVIVDPRCKSLRGFAGARWIAQEYMLPLNEVNEYFECDLKTGGELKVYNASGEEQMAMDAQTSKPESLVCVWEVFDKRTQTHFFVCDGYDCYLQEPEAVQPTIKHFWPIFPLTFNTVESEPGRKVSLYPPSDVDLLKHPQKEWNRTREALRTHRKANQPKYLTSAELSEEDKANIENAKPHSVIKLQSIPSGADVSKLFVPIAHVPPNPVLYDTSMLQTDILQTAGLQEANLGPVVGNETATGQTIAEQSRMTASASNVDDLDDFLSLLAQSGCEMLVRECSSATAQRIVGPGAVLPDHSRDQFLNDIQLKISAASSGRPNKAVDVANFERIAPFLLQAGANPQAVIREGVRRLDDSVDIPSFFPLQGVQPMAGANAPQAPQPQQPLQELPSQAPVPLAGA